MSEMPTESKGEYSYEDYLDGSGRGRHLEIPSSRDQRSLSTDSLLPSRSDPQGDRRKLLLIYVHGFMGNETSFQNFPAHVHNIVTTLVSDTHIVHTKIYPRYRSRKKITFARDDFSRWLAPHEGPLVDVILIGHSMGGLLSAEVVLIPGDGREPLLHRLLGTINFDVPFLGMHPGVIKSGLASIFQSGPEFGDPTDQGEASSGHPADPNYNPSFENDVQLPMRKGWRGVWHFVNKHSGHLYSGTKQLITSHLEFGGAMADYSGLRARYARVRAIEEPNEAIRQSVVGDRLAPPRVRFVNYYTASTGRPKRPKSPRPSQSEIGSSKTVSQRAASSSGDLQSQIMASHESAIRADPANDYEEKGSLNSGHRGRGSSSKTDIESLDIHDDWDADMTTLAPTSTASDSSDPSSLTDDMHSMNMADTERSRSSSYAALTPTISITAARPSDSLPPVPDLPSRPETPDVSSYKDPDMRKIAEKEHARAIRTYDKAVRHRDKALQDRAKLDEKWERQQHSGGDRPARHSFSSASQKSHRRSSPTQKASQHERDPSPPSDPSTSVPSPEEMPSQKPHKDRKFCTLPPKDSNGQRDPCWVRVLMKDVDEVGAHCGLFFPQRPEYENFVGDVGERIQAWVGEAESERLAKELEEGPD